MAPTAYTRSMPAQFWPELAMAPHKMPRAARSTSASSSTTAASLPPSSSPAGINRAAAAAATLRPVRTLPVKTTASTPASMSAAPTSPPPCTMTTRSGPSASCAAASINAAQRGVNSDGFMTTPLPASSAGNSVRSGMATGKFHGVIRPMTPRGTRSITARLPG